jgi:hypothetical protein
MLKKETHEDANPDLPIMAANHTGLDELWVFSAIDDDSSDVVKGRGRGDVEIIRMGSEREPVRRSPAG